MKTRSPVPTVFLAGACLLLGACSAFTPKPDPTRFYVSTLATLAAARSLQSGVAEPVVEAEGPAGPAGAIDPAVAGEPAGN